MSRFELERKEPHPAFRDALRWYQAQELSSLCQWQEAFSSCAIEGNRLAEICSETLRRMLAGEPVSDRYFLGLCWTMRYNQNIKDRKRKNLRKIKKEPK